MPIDYTKFNIFSGNPENKGTPSSFISFDGIIFTAATPQKFLPYSVPVPSSHWRGSCHTYVDSYRGEWGNYNSDNVGKYIIKYSRNDTKPVVIFLQDIKSHLYILNIYYTHTWRNCVWTFNKLSDNLSDLVYFLIHIEI